MRAFKALGDNASLTDIPPTVARRATVKALSEGTDGTFSNQDLKEVTPWFQTQVSTWMGSSNPRHVAMAATAARELSELTALAV